jgi:hypothetical protein
VSVETEEFEAPATVSAKYLAQLLSDTAALEMIDMKIVPAALDDLDYQDIVKLHTNLRAILVRIAEYERKYIQAECYRRRREAKLAAKQKQNLLFTE